MSRIEATRQGAPAVAYELKGSSPAVIGRSEDAELRVDGDLHLSRLHAEIALEGGRLKVKRLAGSSNPIYHGGVPKEEFFLRAGDYFVIGKTRFTFISSPAAPKAAPQALKTLSVSDLYSIGEASDRLKLLDLLELPEILRSRDRKDFYVHIAGLLRLSTGAAWACVVTEAGKVLGEDAADDSSARHHPSRQLVKKALEDAPQPTLYSWSQPGALMATASEGLDWAACAAARIPGEDAVIFYAAGQDEGGARSRRDEARFVGLVADMVGRSISMDRLLTMEGRLEHFFAGPVVAKILKSPDLKELEPRLAQSTVLFFDIRGYSKRTEENQEILKYISELRRAMTAMTQIIQEERGVVLQYMGDGILACWNVPFEDPEHVDRACRAALRMAEAIGGATAGWSCGIGIHSGEVVAGAIGSEQVFSYGVLGPVVNQASRVEGLTKTLKTSILVTGEVAGRLSPATGPALRVGRFIPAGMLSFVELFALGLGPDARFDSGLQAFEKGDWDAALKHFGELPPAHGPAQFLIGQSIENRRRPPRDWDGTIRVEHK